MLAQLTWEIHIVGSSTSIKLRVKAGDKHFHLTPGEANCVTA